MIVAAGDDEMKYELLLLLSLFIPIGVFIGIMYLFYQYKGVLEAMK